LGAGRHELLKELTTVKERGVPSLRT